MNDDALARIERRVDGVVIELGELRGEVARRFDTVDEAHAEQQLRAARVDWRTVTAIAGTIVVPIVVAIIAASSA